jgi:hypothetical protein
MKISSRQNIAFGCDKCAALIPNIVQTGTDEGTALLFLHEKISYKLSDSSHSQFVKEISQDTRKYPKMVKQLAEKTYQDNIKPEYTAPLSNLIKAGIEKGKALIYILANMAKLSPEDNMNQSESLILDSIATQAKEQPEVAKRNSQNCYETFLFAIKNTCNEAKTPTKRKSVKRLKVKV